MPAAKFFARVWLTAVYVGQAWGGLEKFVRGQVIIVVPNENVKEIEKGGE